jgi:hypothetical protein
MTWDKTLPAGSTAIRASDDQLRDNFVAIEEGGVPYNSLKLSVQGSAPTAVADFGFLYTKDVSSKGELHYRDEDSNDVVMTSAGSLGSSATAMITSDLTAATADINGGTVDATIGGTTPAAGAFTTCQATTRFFTKTILENVAASGTTTEDLGTVGNFQMWMVYVTSDQALNDCRAVAAIFQGNSSSERSVQTLTSNDCTVSVNGSNAIVVTNTTEATRGIYATSVRYR